MTNKPTARRASPEDRDQASPGVAPQTSEQTPQQQPAAAPPKLIRATVAPISLISAFSSGSNVSPSETSAIQRPRTTSVESAAASNAATARKDSSSLDALIHTSKLSATVAAGRAATSQQQQQPSPQQQQRDVSPARGRREAISGGASSHLWPAAAAAAAAEAAVARKSNDSRNKSPSAESTGQATGGSSAAAPPAADSSAPADPQEEEEQPQPRTARKPCWAFCCGCCVSTTQQHRAGAATQHKGGAPQAKQAAAGGREAPHGGRKLMPASQQAPTTTTTTTPTASAGHAKSSERRPPPHSQPQQPQRQPAVPNASRSVRVKKATAAPSSPPSLQQPLSFANSKLQSTAKQTVGDPREKPTVNPTHKPNSNEPNNQRSIEAVAKTGSNPLLKSTRRLLTSKLFPKKFSSPIAPVQHHQKLNHTKKMADQAVIDKLEAGHAKLQATTPEQCHSLLKKYLTREVLDKNKAKKTAMGATLLDVCQSGFENLDSGVGIYAPDAESYTLFADLFNPIIEDYHGGFKATDKHPASDFGDLESLVNVDPDNQFVISTRVRCGRSLQGYPFNPCLTEAQYKEMEAKVSSTLKQVEGDLAGTYYPLTGMTKETQQQLIDDHFLFKEGDRFLQAANACRYWPTGRGIYHNKEKTFLVWVNEEDHLRIISMQKGGDLKTVFGRLVRGARAIEAKVPFSRDDRLGFLTFCPTNLGTTIRASVHIKLPKLAADRKKLEEVASRYNLQVRGTSGEHTESVGGVYDISNKRRLGLTEYQAVREMQDGILELIKIEKSL